LAWQCRIEKKESLPPETKAITLSFDMLKNFRVLICSRKVYSFQSQTGQGANFLQFEPKSQWWFWAPGKSMFFTICKSDQTSGILRCFTVIWAIRTRSRNRCWYWWEWRRAYGNRRGPPARPSLLRMSAHGQSHFSRKHVIQSRLCLCSKPKSHICTNLISIKSSRTKQSYPWHYANSSLNKKPRIITLFLLNRLWAQASSRDCGSLSQSQCFAAYDV
jgi:hypothetical protein